MKDNDSLDLFFSKKFEIINQMRIHGEDLFNQRIIKKIL